jgi:hypothetical protein
MDNKKRALNILNYKAVDRMLQSISVTGKSYYRNGPHRGI